MYTFDGGRTNFFIVYYHNNSCHYPGFRFSSTVTIIVYTACSKKLLGGIIQPLKTPLRQAVQCPIGQPTTDCVAVIAGDLSGYQLFAHN